jgi:hypothetical protein
MSETPRALIDELTAHVAGIPVGEEKTVPPDYLERIKAVGDVPFVVELFRTFADNDLTSWMLRLAFWWEDLPLRVWTELLREICREPNVMYQFVWAASELLAIDVPALVRADPTVSAAVGAHVRRGPAAGSRWWRERLEEQGIDYVRIWRRLAAEGAPMNIDVHALASE